MKRVKRGVTSEASCTSSFSWMQNSLKQDPCLVAAYLQSECASGSWDIQALANDSHYTTPNLDATACQCSWAVYNTIQACAFCQPAGGQTSIIAWPQYKTNCTNLLSNEYYPTNFSIPDQTAIPFWATEDPTQWNNQIFNASVAQALANEGHGDITQESRDGNGTSDSTSNSGGKKTNSGAIAGGVVGGVVFITILGLVAFLLRKRRKRKSHLRSMPSINSHGRSTSEGTVHGYYQPTYKYQNFTPSPGPTLPVSYDPTGYGPYPYDASLLSGSISPPPDTLRGTPLGKNMTGQTMPLVAMNVTSLSPSISDANATMHATHSHTFSNGSTISVFNQSYAPGTHGHEHEEGVIQPYIIPPALPEPMGDDLGVKGGRNSPVPGVDILATAQRKAERRNPPAYSAPEEAFESVAGDSVVVQAPDTTLSGTTLLQGSSATAGTQVGQNDVSNGRMGVHNRFQDERDQHGYPIDRKM